MQVRTSEQEINASNICNLFLSGFFIYAAKI